MTGPAKKGSLGEILAASRIISEADVEAALEEQKRTGCRIGEALVNLGIVTQEDIDWALSNQLDLPYIRLKKESIDPEAVALIPASLARTHTFIPLIKAGGELNIAIADPLNKAAAEAIERLTGLSVNVSVALIREIREMIDHWYGVAERDRMGFSSAAFAPAVLETINEDVSGAKLLDYLLVFILRNRLASLSISPSEERVRISGRRGGAVNEIGTLLLNHYPEFTRRLHMAAATPQSGEQACAGTLTLASGERTIQFRVSFVKGYAGEHVTIKPQASASLPVRLADLAAPKEQVEALMVLSSQKEGITFIASGSSQDRTRVMDLILEERNPAAQNIIVLGSGPGRLRDIPRIPLPETDRERSRLILDLLDHDPDILVIEDATGGLPFAAACRAAMQGVLVLAGLATADFPATLRHLLHARQQNHFLPLFMNGIVAVKSGHLLCPACRREYVPSVELQAAIGVKQGGAFYRSSGCDACGGSGFRERRLLFDVLPLDGEVRDGFTKAPDLAGLEEWLASRGYRGMAEETGRLLASGDLSPEEYLATAAV